MSHHVAPFLTFLSFAIILFGVIDLIIAAYGDAVWEKVKLNAGLSGLATDEWKDSELYPDDAFMEMVNMTISSPEIDSEKVIRLLLFYCSFKIFSQLFFQILHSYGKYVLKYLRDKSFGEWNSNVCVYPSLAVTTYNLKFYVYL